MNDKLSALIIILPLIIAGIAHSVTIRKNWLVSLAQRPIDMGLKVADKRIFGANKTWRGVLVMPIVTAISAILIIPLRDFLPNSLSLRPDIFFVFLGLILGLAYILAELPNSFIKRQVAVGPGARPEGVWGIIAYFIDQFDSATGVALLMFLLNLININLAIWIFLLGGTVHIVFDFLLLIFGVKKSNWRAENVPVFIIISFQIFTYGFVKLLRIFVSTKSINMNKSNQLIGKCIIESNHISPLDVLFATSSLSWKEFYSIIPLRYMTKDDYLKPFWKQLILYPLGSYPAKHSGERTGLEISLEFLANNQSIFIFPEGRIKHGTQKYEVRVGVAYLVKQSGKAVLPIYINQKINKLIPISVIIGLPKRPLSFNNDLQVTAQELFSRVLSLKSDGIISGEVNQPKNQAR